MSLRSAALALTLVSAAACAQTFDATSLGVPVTMASPAGEPPQGEPFKLNQSSVYVFWGMLTLTTPSLEKVLGTQLVGGKSVTNLKISVFSKWSDILITRADAWHCRPAHGQVRGDLVTGGTPSETQGASPRSRQQPGPLDCLFYQLGICGRSAQS